MKQHRHCLRQLEITLGNQTLTIFFTDQLWCPSYDFTNIPYIVIIFHQNFSFKEPLLASSSKRSCFLQSKSGNQLLYWTPINHFMKANLFIFICKKKTILNFLIFFNNNFFQWIKARFHLYKARLYPIPRKASPISSKAWSIPRTAGSISNKD